MKRSIRCAICVILCLCSLICISCSTTPDQVDTSDDMPGWMRNANDKVTLEWYINFSWFSTAWGENAVSKKITEETGVDIELIAPSGNESQKLHAMMASDSLPDILTIGWWDDTVDELIEGGYVYALNELADKYDPYFYEVSDPDSVAWYTKSDGNIYCYPNSSYTPQDFKDYPNVASNQTFLVRKDIYEAIGSPDMTTPEGFADAVRRAAEMYPVIAGEPIIPIGVHEFNADGCDSFGYFLMNLLSIPYEENGEYYDRTTDPNYIEWLKTFRQLCSEGYLSDDIFIDKRVQMEEKIAAGRYFCMMYQRTDMVNQQNELYKNDPNSIYIAVDGPRNANGDEHKLSSSGVFGWTVTFVSKNCKRPDRAIEIINYFMSEHGQKLIYLGIEGVTYDMVDGKPVVRDDVIDLLYSDRLKYDRLYGADDAYWMLQDNAMQSQWMPEQSVQMAEIFNWAKKYTCYSGQYDCHFSPSSEVGMIDQKISALWGATLPLLLQAESEEEFDSLFEDFVKQRDEYGFEEYAKACTLQIKDNKRILGLE